jgi:hypothetical protein
MNTKPHYRRFCKEFCTQKIKTNKTTKGQKLTSGEETSTQGIALNGLQALKSLNRKTTKWQEPLHIY